MQVTKNKSDYAHPWYQVESRLRRLERITVYIAIAFLALAVVLGAGCSGVTLVRAFDGQHADELDELPIEVVEACEILGLVCEPADESYGAVTLSLVDTDDYVQGHTVKSRCRPVAWSVPDPVVIAHEFGHALGLDHVEDESNLMYRRRDIGGDELTHDQRDAIMNGAMRLDACRL